ncbi:glutathione S-transferase [Pisolithus orientalis]|uniref:glutathione S-transferase n=1 Tax=Pisolithus orientalis TaxID=936130 RepID=UPI0022248E69|nr:glutathione S-transferase [Pisolithus orientalis]KAI5981128.1 glutathione S-transferase [Pisolithus orientalis]
MDTGKSYHKQATGAALETVQQHATDQDITLFAGCFCPFVQRVWVALEYLEIPYKVYEVDPYKKPQELLELSSKGLVPALRLNGYVPPRALNESTVILEYLEDLASTSTKRSLLPPLSDPYARALVRLQSDHANPCRRRSWRNGVMEGGVYDIHDCQGYSEATNVLKHYRGLELPRGPKFDGWLNRLFQHPAFKCTCSTEELYLDSYERYAFNRPNTSQVANAINTGRGLP